MPPGTGDAQLSLTQNIPIDGAVVVTTPQDIALLDARKGAEMFRKVNVRLLGLVENMATYSCPHCNHETRLYGDDDRLKNMADELRTSILASVPFHQAVVQGGDAGQPIVLAQPKSPMTDAFVKLAKGVLQALPKLPSGDVTEPKSAPSKWKKK